MKYHVELGNLKSILEIIELCGVKLAKYWTNFITSATKYRWLCEGVTEKKRDTPESGQPFSSGCNNLDGGHHYYKAIIIISWLALGFQGYKDMDRDTCVTSNCGYDHRLRAAVSACPEPYGWGRARTRLPPRTPSPI